VVCLLTLQILSVICRKGHVHDFKILKDSKLKTRIYGLFIVASYGKIIPKEILDLPKYGTLNIHPSPLPLLRGATPLQTAIIEGWKETEVDIILLDEKMDHGHIITRSEKIELQNKTYLELEEETARVGAQLLVKIIPDWVAGSIKPEEQEHDQATFCKKYTLEDAKIDLNNPNDIRKVRALKPEPGTWTHLVTRSPSGEIKEKRIKILSAKVENPSTALGASKLIPLQVIPEGKREMDWEAFLRGNTLT